MTGRGCLSCGNRCGADRAAGEPSICGAGPVAEVSYSGIHHGEEPPISGTRGCGNIFFHHCTLSCVFCQNWQISNADQLEPTAMGPGRLAEEILRLQEAGVHSVGLVSPTSHLATVLPALIRARGDGLRVPVVYNTGGYETVEALRPLDGLVDVYLPDMKYGTDGPARLYSGVAGYVDVNRKAVLEMHRQVGGLVTDRDGLALRGLIVRHLVLPGGAADTVEVLEWMVRHLPRSVHVSLMGQYRPAHRVAAGLFPELNRTLDEREYRFYIELAGGFGLENLFVQDLRSCDVYNPDFREEEPFGQGTGGSLSTL